MKRCTKCGETKPPTEFHASPDGADGRRSWCRECVATRARQWYEANKERIAENGRQYREANKEAESERKRRHYKANRQAVAETVRAYRRANPEWYREKNRQSARIRRARGAGVVGDHTAAEVRALFDECEGRCAYCWGVATTEDHVVPMSRFGSNSIENIVPACGPCNSSKSTKSLADWL